MGKKTYIKPEIREEASILTVRAWVTDSNTDTNQSVLESDTSVWVQDQASTDTSVARQAIAELVSAFW